MMQPPYPSLVMMHVSQYLSAHTNHVYAKGHISTGLGISISIHVTQIAMHGYRANLYRPCRQMAQKWGQSKSPDRIALPHLFKCLFL